MSCDLTSTATHVIRASSHMSEEIAIDFDQVTLYPRKHPSISMPKERKEEKQQKEITLINIYQALRPSTNQKYSSSSPQKLLLEDTMPPAPEYNCAVETDRFHFASRQSHTYEEYPTDA